MCLGLSDEGTVSFETHPGPGRHPEYRPNRHFRAFFRNRLVQSAQREILLQYTGDEVYRYDAAATGLLGVQGTLPETIALVLAR